MKFDKERDAIVNDIGEVMLTGEALRQQMGPSDAEIRQHFNAMADAQRQNIRLQISVAFMNSLIWRPSESWQDVVAPAVESVRYTDELLAELERTRKAR
jgi:hypothetical protein